MQKAFCLLHFLQRKSFDDESGAKESRVENEEGRMSVLLQDNHNATVRGLLGLALVLIAGQRAI